MITVLTFMMVSGMVILGWIRPLDVTKTVLCIRFLPLLQSICFLLALFQRGSFLATQINTSLRLMSITIAHSTESSCWPGVKIQMIIICTATPSTLVGKLRHRRLQRLIPILRKFTKGPVVVNMI